MNTRVIVYALAAVFCLGLGTHAEEAKSGVSLGLTYDGELFSIASGGIDQSTEYLHLVTAELEADLGAALNLEGGTFYLSTNWTEGESPSGLAGDAQGISNIDAFNTWKIYEAWYQQELFEGDLSILFGLYDLNGEFDVIERAGLFLNSSHGIGPDYSQSGENGPSIFPTTSLAGRIRVQPTPSTAVQVGVFDAVPGELDHPHGTRVKLDGDEGFLLAGEFQLLDLGQESSKFAVGGWMYTEESEYLMVSEGSEPETAGNSGFYALGEYPVMRDGDGAREIAVFGRLGMANKDINQFSLYFGGGLTATGLFSDKIDHTVGLSVAAATFGSPYKDMIVAGDGETENGEITIEATGQFQLLEYIAVQPDFQYIMNPGGDPSLDDVIAVGLRLSLSVGTAL